MSRRVLLLGGLLMDRYLLTKAYPQRGQDALITRQFQRPGGCPFNVAVTLQGLGVEPLLWSALSDDEMGRELSRALDARGLSREAVYPLPGGDTGYCVIVLDEEGERTFFTYRGCEGHFDAGRAGALLGEIEMVYVTGIYLLYPEWSRLAVAFIEELAGAGVPVLLDPGPLVLEMEPELLRRVVLAADFITPSTDEVGAMEAALGIEGLVRRVLAHGARAVLETRGSAGAVVHTMTGAVEIPAYPAGVVDTTGTGDSFAAGFMAGYLDHGDILAAAREGSACGSLTAEAMGPHRVFGWAEVRERMGV